MTAVLYYKYSELDKEHQFGLVFVNPNYPDIPFTNFYTQWVFFYLGAFFKGKKMPRLYPYVIRDTPPIKQYKSTHHAEALANYIGNAMLNKINKWRTTTD